MASLSHSHITTNGVRLHCVKAGKGPLVILLHGFPDSWYSWRRQIEPLAKRFTVLAVDLRGYGDSDRPEPLEAYRVRQLAHDIAGLVDSQGRKRAHVVGHDWGGTVAWWFGMMFPYKLDRLVVINSPHPVAFARELRTVSQLSRSWYMFLFQLPWLPEELLASRDYYRLRKAIRAGFAHPERLSDEELEHMVATMAKPGALTAALNYYRAVGRSLGGLSDPKAAPIPNPTMLIWGERDRFLGKRLTEGLEPWFEDLEIRLVPEGGHFVHQEEPERVNALLLAHLRA